jgi:periplasmic protein TonB
MLHGFEDIVYETRNKEYGSYILRQNYHKYLAVGFIIAISSVFLVVMGIFLYTYFDNSDNMEITNSLREDITNMSNITELTLPTPPPTTVKKTEPAYTAPIITDSLDEKEKQEVKIPSKADKDNQKADSLAKAIADKTTKGDTATNPGDTIFFAMAPQVMPEFVGGDQAFINFIRKNLNLSLKKSKNREVVIVQFLVYKTGELKELAIVKGVDPVFDKEVLRVLAMCPPWKPAQLTGGRPTSIKFSLPISF